MRLYKHQLISLWLKIQIIVHHTRVNLGSGEIALPLLLQLLAC